MPRIQNVSENSFALLKASPNGSIHIWWYTHQVLANDISTVLDIFHVQGMHNTIREMLRSD